MTITVKIRRLCPSEGRMKALASITLDDLLAVHDMKVIQGDDRLFVAMPSRRDDNGTFRDIVHPINTAFREQIEHAVLEAYREVAAATSSDT